MLSSFVSAILQVLLDRIAHRDFIDFFWGNHLHETLLDKLKMLLLSVTTVLNDALVKEWVDKLKNAAYDVDDVLDEIATKAIQDKMDPRIVERLKSILEHKNLLGLKEGGVGKPLSLGSETTSLVDEHRVYGRHGDKERVIDFLLAGDSNGEGVLVVAIVGMGGVGKTTLAQILYNDERVRNHFQSRSWASVSEASNVNEITRKAFESFTLMLPKLKRLRVLSLSHYPITNLSDSIRILMHMRYLDLSFTGIECLPDSVSTLYNLETLLLSGCHCLTILPQNMSNLNNLRQLDISGSTITSMPPKFGKLKSLQVLTNFTVGNARGSKISELGKLSKLDGELSIGSLQNVIDAIEASHAQLKSKKYLHELEYKWTAKIHDEESETNVLNMLEPHENVKRLLIQNFGGNFLPNWLGNSPFSSMVFLQLTSCENCKSLHHLNNCPASKNFVYQR